MGSYATSLAQNQNNAVTLASGLNAQQLQLLQQQLQGIQVVSVSKITSIKKFPRDISEFLIGKFNKKHFTPFFLASQFAQKSF